MSISRIQHHSEDFIGMHFINRDYIHIDMNVYPLAIRTGIVYVYPMRRFTHTAKLGFSYKHLLGNMRTEEIRVFTNGDTETTRFIDNFDRNYPGIHLALGSEYRLNNGNALSLHFIFDGYRKVQYANRHQIFSKSLRSFGLRLGYAF